MRIAGLLVLPLVVLPTRWLAGQAFTRWTRSVYPTGVNLSGNTGPQVGVGFGYARRADSLARYLLDATFTATAGYGWRGSWFGSLAFRAPGLWPGWRVVLTGLAQREARLQFLGLGNESIYDPGLVNDSEAYFYKLRRTRYRAAPRWAVPMRSPSSCATITPSGRTPRCSGGRPWLASASSVNNVLVNNT